MSWKERWRTERGADLDSDLMMIWEASHHLTETESQFGVKVWFLEADNRPLAYVLVLQHKKVAFLCKSSFDERYRRFSPGIYALNAAIRDLF
jgi:hypothetical protein